MLIMPEPLPDEERKSRHHSLDLESNFSSDFWMIGSDRGEVEERITPTNIAGPGQDYCNFFCCQKKLLFPHIIQSLLVKV